MEIKKLRKIRMKYARKMNHNGHKASIQNRRIYAELDEVIKEFDETRSLPVGAYLRVCAEMHVHILIRSLRERGILVD